MSRSDVETTEFQLVVRRRGKGPLAPYRLAIVVVFVLLVCGTELIDAAQTGVGIDRALIDAGVAGLFVWIVLGLLNAILRAAAPAPTDPAANATATPDRS